MILGQGGVKMILVDRYDHRIYFCRRKYAEKDYRINSIKENTQIPIFEFEYLKSESNILESGDTG
jgi:hypothetical protein